MKATCPDVATVEGAWDSEMSVLETSLGESPVVEEAVDEGAVDSDWANECEAIKHALTKITDAMYR
jgi:hypothetical protein